MRLQSSPEDRPTDVDAESIWSCPEHLHPQGHCSSNEVHEVLFRMAGVLLLWHVTFANLTELTVISKDLPRGLWVVAIH